MKKKIRPDITVSDLDGVKRAILPFTMEQHNKDIDISAQLEWTEDGKKRKGFVKAISRDLTAKQLLVEGFFLVKTRMELAGKMKEAAELEDDDEDLLPERLKWELFDIDSQYFHVDALIRRELGGFRKGLRVRWDIKEGTFEFDPFECKLYKVD